MREKTAIFWSGGKDSALALYKTVQDKNLKVVYLVTTINKKFGRVSMHGVREELIELQAASIGITLKKMYVSEGTNEEYENKLGELFSELRSEGIKKIIFGDIFLEDLKLYRDAILNKADLEGIYPLWKRNTSELIQEFLALGFKTITCCVNDACLDKSKVGILLDKKFISDLPANVDPCGENGEFHTFCFAGTVFKNKIEIKIGDKIYKPLEIKTDDKKTNTTGFWYCDIFSAV